MNWEKNRVSDCGGYQLYVTLDTTIGMPLYVAINKKKKTMSLHHEPNIINPVVVIEAIKKDGLEDVKAKLEEIKLSSGYVGQIVSLLEYTRMVESK